MRPENPPDGGQDDQCESEQERHAAHCATKLFGDKRRECADFVKGSHLRGAAAERSLSGMKTLRLGLGLLASTTAIFAAPAPAPAAQEQPARRSVWNGYERIDFTLAGRACVLVLPKTAAERKPWIWRTEFFDHQPQADLALLARGWHVAYMDVRGLYGARRAMELFGQFYSHLVVHAGLAQRVVLEGFSRGGLSAVNFAASHPNRVAALYLDAPVIDFRSWPGRNSASTEWAECLAAYGLTEQTAANSRANPVNRIPELARGRVPVIVVAGDTDDVVPFAENGAIIEQRLREAGGTIEVILKRGVGHQPHSLEDPTPIVDFLLKHARY